jgi:hypothetical protein
VSATPQPQCRRDLVRIARGSRRCSRASVAVGVRVDDAAAARAGAILSGSLGQPSLQSRVASPSVSVSATPQPQAPGAILSGSCGQPSTQSAVPSLSASVEHAAAAHARIVLSDRVGQPSMQSARRSPSVSDVGHAAAADAGRDLVRIARAAVVAVGVPSRSGVRVGDAAAAAPGAILFGSLGQPSAQSAVPSRSVSTAIDRQRGRIARRRVPHAVVATHS